MLTKHVGGRDEVLIEVAGIITEGMQAFAPNRRMTPAMIALWAETLVDDHRHESLADIALFMRRAGTGEFDSGEFYASVDVARISKWWTDYLEKKAEARENLGLSHASDLGGITNDDLITGLAKAGFDTTKARLELGRSGIDNRSKRDDRLRADVPLMTADQLRAAYVVNKDAWARRMILVEADKRGLVSRALKRAEGVDGDAQAQEEADRFAAEKDQFPTPPHNP